MSIHIPLHIFANIPLFIRVVCLYGIAGGMFWTGDRIQALTATPAQPASIQIVSQPGAATQPSKKIISGEPSRLSVARLGVDLPVKDGFYDSETNDWTLSHEAVFFARMTTIPNDSKGNTFIYGHNTDAMLAPLSELVVDDIITIFTTNGHAFQYKYTRDDIIAPNVTTVLYDSPSSPQLTVMTCEGIWSKVRRVMYFDFVGVQ